MLHEQAVPERALRTLALTGDLCVVGGGMAGVCCAVTAARAGVKVVLVQDRPVLGGNASSEVRLWTLGATSHMLSNNRWAREGGVVNELLVENVWRNPEGNPLLFDALLLEAVASEPNITLLLNTAVSEAAKADGDTIASVRAFCSQNSTLYDIAAPLFCDASGDGIVGFLSGAAFRMGAEAQTEFGEAFAPSQEYGELLGHSLYFYSKDTGRPVRFVPPAFALSNVERAIPRFRAFNTSEYGCRLWWMEYGGRLDTVHDTEVIKWELWRVVYGVWDYIKNSGKFPDAANLTLEWVGHIPGKRESRRFEGDYILRQQDIIQQTQFTDAVAFGGWSIDLHPADGVFSERPGCNQWHSRGVYGIPYRCLYSRNIANLFLAGRILSATHVAFGSSRVMATCAHAAQAVGMAAAQGVLPRAVDVARLQSDLLRSGQHIPGLRLADSDDLAQSASVTASSRFRLHCLPPDGPLLPLDRARAQMLPLPGGRTPQITLTVNADADTVLCLELRTSDRPDNHTPDVLLAEKRVALKAGDAQPVTVDFGVVIDTSRYVFLCVGPNPRVSVQASETRVTGLLSVVRQRAQLPPEDIGVQAFDFWWPERRPAGHNFALSVEPPLDVWSPESVTDGLQRPTDAPHAWTADPADPAPTLHLQWPAPQTIGRVELTWDTDWEHPMETVLWGHPETAMPFCVKYFRVRDGAGRVLAENANNHQTRQTLTFDPPAVTDRLTIECISVWGNAPGALFEVRCYAP